MKHPELEEIKQKNHWRRMLRAQTRDTLVMLQESGVSLLLFFLLLVGGAFILFLFYVDPQSGERIGFSEALYGTFSLFFFQPTLEFPENGMLQMLFFLLPVLGLLVVVDGFVRFGIALVNKKQRGQKWQVAMASTYNKHVIICGVGKVGYRVALELLKFGREVVAIEANEQGRFIEKVQALGIPLILADARRSENLIKAGIQHADAIIPCTDDELANLDIALDAREINPDVKIVMRMFDPDLAQRVEKGFGIHTAFSVSALAAPVFAAASMRVNVKSSFYVGQQLLNISEFTVMADSKIAGWNIERLEQALDLSVVSYMEGEQTLLHPQPELTLKPGNRLLVLATLDTLHQLDALNQRSG